MKTIYLFIGAFFLAALYACEQEGVSCEDINLTETLSSEVDAVTIALTTYTIEPTDENCLALKETYQVIIDALAEYEDCEFDSEDQSDYDNFLQTAQMGISFLSC